MAHDADWGTRQGAVWLVGQWQLPGAIPHLRAVITRPDEDEQVRYMAALALTLIPTAGAAQTLHELTENPLDAVQRVAQSAKHAVWYTDC
jgi:HEAT repeat protein